MTEKASDAGIKHAEYELQVQPRTFARERSSVFANVDRLIREYADTRAFAITGLIKEDILQAAKNYVTEWVVRTKSNVPTEEMVQGLLELLSDWLPTKDAAGRVVSPAARATVIARTNVSDIFNNTRFQIFTSPQLESWIEAFVYSAILDGRTTELCRTLNGRIFTREDVQGFVPPNHFNCRSTLHPVTRLDVGWEEVYVRQQSLTVAPQEGFQT